MPAHKKRLAGFVRDGSFLARRHDHLLVTDPLVGDPGLRSLQERYRAETSKLEQRALALEFEKACRNPLIRDDDERPPGRARPRAQEREPTYEEVRAELAAIIRGDLHLAQALHARRLRRGGRTLAAIARELGVSPTTVRRRLAQLCS